MPTAWPSPWPSEPPVTSTPGEVSSVLMSSRLPSAREGRELRHRDHAGLGQHRPERDGVVPGREHEPVAILPVEVLRVPAQLVEDERGQHVGDAQPLAQIALALAGGHLDHQPAQVLGARAERVDVGMGRRMVSHEPCLRAGRAGRCPVRHRRTARMGSLVDGAASVTRRPRRNG